MLSDGLTAKQADGSAREEVEVLDVAQLLLASVKRTPAPSTPPASDGTTPAPAGADAATATAVLERPTEEQVGQTAEEQVETKAEPEPADVTQTEDTVTEPAEVGAAAEASTQAETRSEPEAEPGPEQEAGAAAEAERPAEEKQDDTLF
jgi:hypothetical protein